MAQVAQGVVAVIMDSKFGKGEFRLKLDDQEQWYNLSKRYEGLVEQGNTIAVRFEQSGKKAQVTGIKLITEGTPVQTPAAAGTPQSRDGYWSAKEARDINVTEPRIVYANARDHALRVVELLLVNGALLLPAVKKVAERETVIVGTIDRYTARFFTDSLTQAAVGRAASEASPDVAAPGDPEEAAIQPVDDLDDDIPF